MAVIEALSLALPFLFNKAFFLLASSGCVCIVFWVASYEYMFVGQTIKTNVIGTLNMLGLAKRVGAR